MSSVDKMQKGKGDRPRDKELYIVAYTVKYFCPVTTQSESARAET